jgi:beta-mannosidase
VLEVTLLKDDVVVGSATRAIEVAPHGHFQSNAMGLFDNFYDLSYAHRFGPPAHTLLAARLRRVPSDDVSEAFHFPQGLSAISQIDPAVQGRAVILSDTEVSLTVNTVHFAQSVTISMDGLISDDQYFHLAPRSERTVRLRGDTRGRRPSGMLKALNSRTAARIEIVE